MYLEQSHLTIQQLQLSQIFFLPTLYQLFWLLLHMFIQVILNLFLIMWIIVFIIIPIVVRSSLMAKYFIYIGGTCEVPCNYFSGVILPWIVAAIINHLEIYDYLVNWTAIICSLYVQFVCPMFMWSKSVKEAQIYENNFK